MKLRNICMGLIVIFIVVLMGCSNGTTNKTQTKKETEFIKVETPVGNTNTFKEFRKVTDEKQVQQVKEILKEAKWTYSILDTVRPASYQFTFQSNDSKTKKDVVLHQILVDSDQGILIIIRDDKEHTQLTKEQSSTIFEIITDAKAK